MAAGGTATCRWCQSRGQEQSRAGLCRRAVPSAAAGLAEAERKLRRNLDQERAKVQGKLLQNALREVVEIITLKRENH